MKTKTIRFTSLVIICIYTFIFSSCTNNSKELSPDFNKYISKFELSTFSVSIDSTTLVNLKNNFEELLGDKIENLIYFQIPDLIEKCDEYNKFDIYPYRCINCNEFIVLVYYLKLNSNCALDAYDNKFILVVYNLQGVIIAHKEIGRLYEMWEYENYIYSKLDTIKHLSIENVEFKHDYELNTNEIIRNNYSFVINEKGITPR